MKKLLLITTTILLCSGVTFAKPSKPKKTTTAEKNKSSSGKTESSQVPSLAPYGLYAKTAPKPTSAEASKTKLPLKLNKGARIAFIGNTLLDRAADFGYFETYLHQEFPDHDLVIRNLAWSADEVDLQPRPANFASVDQHLTHYKIDVIFAAFGYNESFAGIEAIPVFKVRLATYLERLRTSAFNGQSSPQIVLISPTANENIEGVNGADMNNGRIAAYAKAMREVANEKEVAFVDVFRTTQRAMANTKNDLTINGVHLTDAGYKLFAESLYKGTFGKETTPTVDEQIRAIVIDKAKQFFYRYRPVNTFYYTGGRNGRYGYLDFLPAMQNFEIMVSNRDQRIWGLAKGEKLSGPIDDSNVPPLPETQQSRGANKWMTPADELAAFKIDPRFSVNCFASEEDFPELACPIQIRWDAKGRLWVACSTTYPHVYPGNAPNDKLIILEDTNGDGKADKCSTFADDLHIPLSFEFGDGGVYLSEEPHFTFIKDTNGDGKADYRRKVFTGFGTEDSHHALHDFVWTPDGDLLFRESIFHNSQVETVYGPVRAKNSAWFRYRPDSHRLISFGCYPNTNPWGVTYDDWGHHVASHPNFASSFHALNPPYPSQHPKASGITAYSGTAGQEFIDFDFWPKEMQGGFLKARYKPTNRIEFHTWTEKEDHFAESYQSDIIFSTNLSFIPVDIRFGPRGAMYVCDWYNPIKGHAQYSLRDERRDRKSGRIWRIVPKNTKLAQPPRIMGAPITELLNILKRPEYRYRYWAKRELRERDKGDVKTALDRWVRDLDAADTRYRHHQVEAIWMYRNIGAVNAELLIDVLNCETPLARAAATRQLRYWSDHLSKPNEALRARANDEHGITRLEAIIAASYIGTEDSLEAAIDVLKHPTGNHLKYAIQTSLGSEPLARIWKNNPAFTEKHPDVSTFIKDWGKHSKITAGTQTRNASEANYDSQKHLKTIEISCVPERMLFTVTEFSCKAGQPLKIIFTNPDATQHNIVFVQPGAVEEIGMAGNEMAKDPNGITKHFVPDSDKIFASSKLLNPDTAEVLRFKAPEKPGKYPYVCTFPGHWVIMRGIMTVE